jgi:site-specific recombinase XerD
MGTEDIQRLTAAILDYRQWAQSLEKRQGRWPAMRYKKVLLEFLRFAVERDLRWEQVFTYSILEEFRCHCKATGLRQALIALGTFLYSHGKIDRPIELTMPREDLPEIYEQYLRYIEEVRELSSSYLRITHRVLVDLHRYLTTQQVELAQVKIEHLDTFMATYKVSDITRQQYRYLLRGFLKYLYYERKILKQNLAVMLVGRPLFAPVKLPRFLRPEQIQRLFASLTLDTPGRIRTAAMVHLAFYLGLRPVEISRIRLDDISFEKAQLRLPDRKRNNPVTLPVPVRTLKIVGVYIKRVRPQSPFRELFLRLTFPYRPAPQYIISSRINNAMRKAGLPGSAYWLRHSYAQQLLHDGATIYEIKEMLGHQRIQSSHRYVHISVALMRKVLFDEDL